MHDGGGDGGDGGRRPQRAAGPARESDSDSERDGDAGGGGGDSSKRAKRRRRGPDGLRLTELQTTFKTDGHLVANTPDHEDHTFNGIMFKIGAKFENTPFEYVEVQRLWPVMIFCRAFFLDWVLCFSQPRPGFSFPRIALLISFRVRVRGWLGPMTVWVTPETYEDKEESQAEWTRIYSQNWDTPSPAKLVPLDLERPITIKPGDTVGVYVHSALFGDKGLVYDNNGGFARRSRDVTIEDDNIAVYPGIAHIANVPFSPNGYWGFAWRNNRQFVGRVQYGIKHRLWTPKNHGSFAPPHRLIILTVLLCHHRLSSTIAVLPDHVVLYILNFIAPFKWKGMQNVQQTAGNRLVVVSPRKAPLRRLLSRVSTGCTRVKTFFSRKFFGGGGGADKKKKDT